MDPLTVASGVAALAGLGFAWRMRRRAARAEAQIAALRAACAAGRSGTPATTVPNQRPWRMVPPNPRSRTRPP